MTCGETRVPQAIETGIDTPPGAGEWEVGPALGEAAAELDGADVGAAEPSDGTAPGVVVDVGTHPVRPSIVSAETLAMSSRCRLRSPE